MTNDEIDARLKRIEELLLQERPKPKQELHIDPKAVRASMAEKGWNQSDLAAQLFGRRINSAGKNDAIGKDRISVWLSGKACPSPKHFALLRQFVDIV
jgi:hypothetical protein